MPKYEYEFIPYVQGVAKPDELGDIRVDVVLYKKPKKNKPRKRGSYKRRDLRADA